MYSGVCNMLEDFIKQHIQWYMWWKLLLPPSVATLAMSLSQWSVPLSANNLF